MLTRSHPAVLAALALAAAALAAPAQAAGPYLKLKAKPESVAADQPVTLTLTAVSGRTVTLPAPVIAVDEGQGFAARTDLQCTPTAETNVTPDKAATTSCEIKLSRAGKSRVRFEYRLPGGMARTNAVAIEVGGARRADE